MGRGRGGGAAMRAPQLCARLGAGVHGGRGGLGMCCGRVSAGALGREVPGRVWVVCGQGEGCVGFETGRLERERFIIISMN